MAVNCLWPPAAAVASLIPQATHRHTRSRHGGVSSHSTHKSSLPHTPRTNPPYLTLHAQINPTSHSTLQTNPASHSTHKSARPHTPPCKPTRPRTPRTNQPCLTLNPANQPDLALHAQILPASHPMRRRLLGVAEWPPAKSLRRRLLRRRRVSSRGFVRVALFFPLCAAYSASPKRKKEGLALCLPHASLRHTKSSLRPTAASIPRTLPRCESGLSTLRHTNQPTHAAWALVGGITHAPLPRGAPLRSALRRLQAVI